MRMVTIARYVGDRAGKAYLATGGTRRVVIAHQHSRSGRVVAFVAFVDTYPVARAPLLRDVRMALARLYPELPRERRKRKR